MMLENSRVSNQTEEANKREERLFQQRQKLNYSITYSPIYRILLFLTIIMRNAATTAALVAVLAGQSIAFQWPTEAIYNKWHETKLEKWFVIA